MQLQVSRARRTDDAVLRKACAGGRLARLAWALLLVLVAATVVAVSPVGVVGQEIADADALEVRIVARRVASERVEFALQQREPDADWGSRLLPRQRLFPLGTTQGRWLVSTPLSLSGAAVEVRIVARQIAGGRVEFALQRRELGGDWEPRLLPQRRLFPISAALGRWLVSSPLTLPVDDIEPPSLVEEDIDPPPDSPPSDTPSDPPPSDPPPPPTTQPQVDPVEELASLVLAGANSLRGGLAPLSLDDGVSTAATAWAEAQAENDEWLLDFDFSPWLAAGWDVWFAGTSTRIASELDDARVARILSDSLLGQESNQGMECDFCTHLGVGAATAGGRTFATVVLAGPAPTENAIAAAEAQMADLINRLRVSLGLNPLTYHSAIAGVARRWSQTLAAERGPHYHNPHFIEQYPAGAQGAGENVHSLPGSSFTSLSDAMQQSFDDFVKSPGHYANIVRPDITHLGVGIALSNRYWVTQNFARYPAGAQTGQSGPPGAATVTATGGAYEFSARWSADANGAAITSWEFLGSLTATFDDAVTSYTWTSVVAGRYTIQVRACNDDGCGDWGSATVTVTDPAPATPGTRSVEVSQGANAQGVVAGCASANCHYVRVTLVNFEPGTYTVHCWHYGVAGYPAGEYGWYTTSGTVSEACIWGFAGHDTYVIVEDPQTGEPVRSNNAQWP